MIYKHSFLGRAAIWTLAALFAPIVWLGEKILGDSPSPLRPHELYRPTLTLDGDQWCALYGDDLQAGIAGFGFTPAEALEAFDHEWQLAKQRDYFGQLPST